MNWFLAVVGAAVMFSAGLLFGAVLAALGNKNSEMELRQEAALAINDARQQGFQMGITTGEGLVQQRILTEQLLGLKDEVGE